MDPSGVGSLLGQVGRRGTYLPVIQDLRLPLSSLPDRVNPTFNKLNDIGVKVHNP